MASPLLLALLLAAAPAGLPPNLGVPFAAIEGREVSPLSGRAVLRDAPEVGVLDAGDHDRAVLSLAAWVPPAAGGSVSLVLVPDVGIAREAIERGETTPLSLRLTLPLGSSGTTAHASSEALLLAFPRWRVFLVNQSGTTLKVSAFVRLID